jgi:hypothetical protein
MFLRGTTSLETNREWNRLYKNWDFDAYHDGKTGVGRKYPEL